MTAFLMTWKEDHWPHENILRMLQVYRTNGSVREDWRIAAHTKVHDGAKVWLLKQGKGQRGIFGFGEVVGAPHKASIFDGTARMLVPVRFDVLSDPLKGLLIGEADTRKILSETQIATQSSGITITDEQSNEFARVLVPESVLAPTIDPTEADDEPFDPENVADARQRVLRRIAQRRGQKAFRDELLQAYDRRCALTGCPIVDILEAAHIFPYLGPQTNHISNGLLLRSDIHTLFDCGLWGVSPKDRTVIVAPALRGTTYNKLHGRKLRASVGVASAPSKKALEMHLKANGLWPLPKFAS